MSRGISFERKEKTERLSWAGAGLMAALVVAGHLSVACNSSASGPDSGTDSGGENICGSAVCESMTYLDGGLFEDEDECTHVLGNVDISEIDPAALEPIRELRCIDGDLIVCGSPLSDLDALANLVRVQGEIRIGSLERGNADLVSVEGLAGVESVVVGLNVLNNDALGTLDGLYNIAGITTGSLDVRYNDSLRDISGLAGLHHTGDYIFIRNNPCLPPGQAEEVASGIVDAGFGGVVSVGNNGAGCGLDGGV